ncbi:MAG: CopG family antitoxin [Chloroflexota bacterium]
MTLLAEVEPNENKLHFDTYEGVAAWFDASDMADYEQQLTPIEFHFDLRKDRDWVELEHSLAQMIRKLAQERGISTRALVNQWLYERVSQ